MKLIFRTIILYITCLSLCITARANKLLIPMDATGQKNHLKAYGIAFAAIKEGIPVYWLLNYKGGSFAMDNEGDIADMCRQQGVTCKNISSSEYAAIIKKIEAPSFNGKVIKLDKAPRIAVYTPLNKEPWDDAVTMALTYAGIPFDKIYANEVLAGDLKKYDWLHLHHEDFTGQYSKFWANYHNTPWYQNDQRTMEALAAKNGFNKVSQMQLAVVKKIKEFVGAGGNLFAMCSATETFDIALAASGTDICDTPFDGDPADPFANDKLDFTKCLAFKGFSVVTDPYSSQHSNIDFPTAMILVPEAQDYFSLTQADAKKDPVSAMLCQNHVTTIKGFMGQTTAFRSDMLKPGVTILGRNVPITNGGTTNEENIKRIKYIHGDYKKGTWTFYGGHDPESYMHMVGSAPTNLADFPNSPGYRLILNNLLLPAAKKALAPAAPVTKATEETQPTEENIPDPKKFKGKLYPDLSNNELIIVFDPADKKTSGNAVTIVNSSNVEVFSQSYNTEKATIDLKDLPMGIYVVKVNGEYAGKLAKQ